MGSDREHDRHTTSLANNALSEDTVSDAKRRLWEATADSLQTAVGNLREAWYTGDEAIFYRREEQALNKYLVPFRCGLAAFAVTFTGFRLAGNPGFRSWRSRVFQRRRSSPPKPPNHRATPKGYNHTHNHTHNHNHKQERARNSLSVVTDVLVSGSVGVSGALLLLQVSCGTTARDDLERAPLVAGRSLVADSLCPGLLELSRSDPGVGAVMDKQHHESGDGGDGDDGDSTLKTFATVIGNCQRRTEHEAWLRRERQPGTVLPSGAIAIPHTGGCLRDGWLASLGAANIPWNGRECTTPPAHTAPIGEIDCTAKPFWYVEGFAVRNRKLKPPPIALPVANVVTELPVHRCQSGKAQQLRHNVTARPGQARKLREGEVSINENAEQHREMSNGGESGPNEIEEQRWIWTA
eukprot:jgi/Psemu1/2074/gm1.2074_g